jgi:hypothetical protein
VHLLAPNPRTVADYEPYSRVVFLGDGLPNQWRSLAELIHQVFPDKLVVKGDFEIPGTFRSGNFVAMHMDHNHRLPIPSGSVDLVLMRRGLCLCHGATLCGGLRPHVPTMRRFFADVYRTLDPSNPNAVAYLQGSAGPSTRVETFRQAAAEAMTRDPRIRVEFVEEAGIWHAVRITHAPAQPN